MAEVQLVAEARRKRGSGESRRLRAAGKVPAVLYGHGIEPKALAVDARELRGALNQEAGLNALLSLRVDGGRHLAMARQLQRHPVRGTVMHVDFVVVRLDEVVSAEVPVRIVGEAIEVERARGVVEQVLFALAVHAKPADIPSHLDVDVSELEVGDTLRVGDLRLPPGVTTDVDGEEPVIVAAASTVAAEIAAEEEAAAEAAEEEEAAFTTDVVAEQEQAPAAGGGDEGEPGSPEG